MKKFMFAAIALFAVFALVGCGGSSDDPVTPPPPAAQDITITFNANGGTFTTPSDATRTVKAGAAIGALPDVSWTIADLAGWKTAAVGGTDVTAASTFTVNTTVFAHWTPKPQADKTVRFLYDDEKWQDVTFEPDTDTWGFVIAALDRKRDVKLDQTKGFKAWADASNAEWTDDTVVITNSKMEMKAVWYNATFTDIGTAEKLYLENGTAAVFEFVLPEGKTLANIKNILADFKFTEEVFKNAGTRGFRVFGPYFYNENPTVIQTTHGWSNGTVQYGDFAVDRNGVYIAKFNGEGDYNATDMRKMNKFHPYFGLNGAGGWLGPDGSGNPWDKAPEFLPGAAIAADAWFPVSYNFVQTTGNTDLGRVIRDIEATMGEIWDDTTTDMTKVYFGIGFFTTQEGGSSGDIGYDRFQGVTQLVKNVKMTFSDDTTVNGAPPSFGNGKVFAGYLPAGVVYSYRGAGTDPIAFPQNPGDSASLTCICPLGSTQSPVFPEAATCGKPHCANAFTFCRDLGCALAGRTADTSGDLLCTLDCVGCDICTAAGKAPWECTCDLCIAERAKGATNDCICADGTCTVQKGGSCNCPVCWIPVATADFVAFKVGENSVTDPIKNGTDLTDASWQKDADLFFKVEFPTYSGTAPAYITNPPTNFDLRSYKTFTIKVKFILDDDSELDMTKVPGNEAMANVKWVKDASSIGVAKEDAENVLNNNGAQTNGLGQAATTNGPINAGALSDYTNFDGFVFQTQGGASRTWIVNNCDGAKFIKTIEIHEIIFHK